MDEFFASINASFSPASLRIRKWKNSHATRTDHLHANAAMMDVRSEKKDRRAVDIHGPAQRSATPYRSGMHYLCFRRSRKPAETGRSIYLRDVNVVDARAAHSLAFSLSFMLLSLSRFRIALPQVVGPVRVIQGISAETDVGVDRRVSFSHPSRGPTICHGGAPPDPFPPPNVFGERRQPIRSRLINHAIN